MELEVITENHCSQYFLTKQLFHFMGEMKIETVVSILIKMISVIHMNNTSF